VGIDAVLKNLLNCATVNRSGLNFPNRRTEIMKTATKVLLALLAMALFDVIIPIPITVLMLIYVLYQKPEWFREMVEEIYGS
jgi:hypothetical protein